MHNSIDKKTLSRIIVAIGLFGFILMQAAKHLMGVSLPVSFFLLYYCGIALMADRDDLIALTLCCIAFGTSFQNKYAILFCLVTYIIKFRGDFASGVNKAVLPIACMFTWEILHIGGSFSVGELLRVFCELFFCGIIMAARNQKYDFKRISQLHVFMVTECNGWQRV